MTDRNANIIKTFAVVLILLLGVASFFNWSFGERGISKADAIELVKQKIDLEDSKKISEKSESFLNTLKSENALRELANDLKLGEDSLELLEKAIDATGESISKAYRTDMNEIIAEKNQIVYKHKEEEIKYQRVNYWLVALIILSAGLIGGWARINYGLLLPLTNNLEELITKMRDIKKEIDESKSATLDTRTNEVFARAAGQVGRKAEDFEERVNSILEDMPTREQRIATSMIFGVIASSITLLALKTADSDVFKFEDNMDYFILWAWCLLGAIYAKDSIERIYKKNFN